jgi:hypothetical protein
MALSFVWKTAAEFSGRSYAADSKSMSCVFCPLRNCLNALDVVEENSLDALKPFADIFGHFEAF